MRRFNSVVFDVDSTLSGVEGIDWLASLRGSEVETRIAEQTKQVMLGQIALETVYGQRLSAVKPRLSEVEELGRVYIAKLAPTARQALHRLREEEVELAIVSGGLLQAILPLATVLGVEASQVHAVSAVFDDRGEYLGFDERSLLSRQNGKRETVARMILKSPILAVGDGMTDCEIRPAVAAFAAYTGFVRREPVVERADYVVENFDQLRELVLG